jgi:hypothetical protein
LIYQNEGGNLVAKHIYTITVSNWSKYNNNIKKGHKATLIANNFCSDNKLGTLPLTVRWLFLGILLTCGDHTTDTVELNDKQLRDLLESSWSVDRALDALKQLQLLSYEKNAAFINRIEKKVIENKRKEENSAEPKSPPPAPVKIDRRGVIPELEHPDVIHLLDGVHRETQTAWLKAYPNAKWIIHEALKADVWIKANPHKAPKKFARFFSNWLSRAFEDYRKGLPSNSPHQKTYAQKNADANDALRAKLREEKNDETRDVTHEHSA